MPTVAGEAVVAFVDVARCERLVPVASRSFFRRSGLSVTAQLAGFQVAVVRRAVLLPVLDETQSCREGLKARVAVKGAQLR
jgi:hypothetical protein